MTRSEQGGANGQNGWGARGDGDARNKTRSNNANRSGNNNRNGSRSSNHQNNRPRLVGTLTRPVFFVGFMGAGKTSVARRLARTCGIASVDMDTYLERREGKRVKEIFAAEGEEGFRVVETDVLRELAGKDEPLLVSCGGGVVKMDENRGILKESGFVVHLKVTADEAKSRISDTSTRPLFQNLDSARRTAIERGPLYEEVADVTIDTAGKSVPAIAREVQNALEKEGILCLQRR